MATQAVQMAMADECRINVVPLVDLIVQVVVFFLLVTDMSAQEIARVSLPQAVHAFPDEKPPDRRITINVTYLDNEGNGEYKPAFEVRRKNYNYNALREKLKEFAVEGGSTTKNDLGLSDNWVIIRADAKAPWESIQLAQKACMEAKLWKISFGAIRLDKSGKPVSK